MPLCLEEPEKGYGGRWLCPEAGPVLPPSACPGRASGALPVTWAAEGSSSPDPPPPSRAPGGRAWAAPAGPPGPALLSSGHRALW